MSTSALARVVFGLLVVSTVGAFFVTQRLKRTPPPVKRIVVPHYIAPRSDGPNRIATMRFSLPKADYVTVSVVNFNGDEVLRLLDDRPLHDGVHYFKWNGRDGTGRIPPDGFYFMRVVLHGQGRSVTSPVGMDLVTRVPSARIVSVTPNRIAAGPEQAVTLHYDGPTNPPARFTVYRTDHGPVHAVATFSAARGSNDAHWDGTIGDRPAPAGIYAFAVTVENKARITGTWPKQLPPTNATALPNTGLSVVNPAAAGTLEPVTAGGEAEITYSGAIGRVRYDLVRAGTAKPLRTGAAIAPDVSVPVPASAPTGLYEVRLRAGADSAAFPLAVRGRTGGSVLVVLPAVAWQALNPVDDDASGFPKTLLDTTSVSLTRPLAAGRDPAASVAPLLAFLDAHHLRYDITTDVALTAGHGPALAGHRGVVFAGDERWASPVLNSALTAYASGGGHVAMFGTSSFRNPIAIGGGRVTVQGPPSAADAFGEQTGFSYSEAAPLVVASDSLGLFSQTTGDVGLFTTFEQSQALPAGASVLSAAGRDPVHPSFVAYRIGKGLVVRTGTPQWTASLATDQQVDDVTTRLWSLLSP